MKRHGVLSVFPALSLASWGTSGKSSASISTPVKQGWNVLFLGSPDKEGCTEPWWQLGCTSSRLELIQIWPNTSTHNLSMKPLIHWPGLKRNRSLELKSRWVLSPLLLFNLAGMSVFSFKMNWPSADGNSLAFRFQTKNQGVWGNFLINKKASTPFQSSKCYKLLSRAWKTWLKPRYPLEEGAPSELLQSRTFLAPPGPAGWDSQSFKHPH